MLLLLKHYTAGESAVNTWDMPAAPLRILELLERQVGQGAGKAQVVGAQRPVLHEFEQRAEQEGVVVEVGIEVRAAVFVSRQQPSCRTSASPWAPLRLALRAPGLRHPQQQFVEPRQAVARALREIGAAEEGLALGGEEHRQRPAARAPGQQLVGCLIDPVDVGSLLPVDLDVDEMPVHQRGGVVVFEAFVRHYMAPVAGRVADRQQDRPLARARQSQRLGAPGVPGVPVHRVGGVLLQIGAGFVGQTIAHAGSA